MSNEEAIEIIKSEVESRYLLNERKTEAFLKAIDALKFADAFDTVIQHWKENK